MPFNANVTTNGCLWDNLEDQVRKKINEIADDEGRGSHGGVTLSSGVRCQHWRAGSYRIFGTYASGVFNLIGYGEHTGRGNDKYKVELCGGGSTKAQTS